MELAKVTSKGQITIPRGIRTLLRLKTGDKVFFEESCGKIYITNASQRTLSNVQTHMQGEAEKMNRLRIYSRKNLTVAIYVQG